MSLSCSCGFDNDYAWYFFRPNDYSTFDSKRRKRCSSCNKLIDIGATIADFECYRSPRYEVEEKIYGDEVPIANKTLCEECADIYFSLQELGFDCVTPDENMRELAKEYKETYS